MSDYFGRSARQFENMSRRYGMMPQEKSNLTPSDKAGIGLQVGGAVISDMEEQKAREEAERIRKEDNNRALMLGARDTRTSAADTVAQQQTAQRGQNVNAFDRMMQMRENAMQNASKYSFRRGMLKAMGA